MLARGHLGRQAEAKKALADLLQVKADFSLATIDETIRFKHPADRAHLLEGLRKAGLED